MVDRGMVGGILDIRWVVLPRMTGIRILSILEGSEHGMYVADCKGVKYSISLCVRM